MTRFALMAGSLCLALCACGAGGGARGVGFTGIDGEPSGPWTGAGGGVSQPLGPIEALAALPPRAVSVPGAATAVGVAIDSGGRSPATALPVELLGTPLMLSLVTVDGRLYAVLRLPEGQRSGLPAGVAQRFGAAVPMMTGCLAAGPVTLQDRPQQIGAAVPLDCR